MFIATDMHRKKDMIATLRSWNNVTLHVQMLHAHEHTHTHYSETV